MGGSTGNCDLSNPVAHLAIRLFGTSKPADSVLALWVH